MPAVTSPALLYYETIVLVGGEGREEREGKGSEVKGREYKGKEVKGREYKGRE